MTDKKEKKVEDSDFVTRKEFNALAAKVRKYSDNWKVFCKMHLGDIAKDGKIGGAKIGLALVVFIMALTALLVVSAYGVQGFEAGDKVHWGVAAVRSNGDFDSDGGAVIAGSLTAASITSAGAISGVSSGGATSPIATATLAHSDVGNMRKTVITVANAPITYLTTGTNLASGVKIMDFPEGRILVHGVTADNLTCATNAFNLATAKVSWAIGTAVGAGNAMTTTEVDLAPTTSVAQVTSRVDNALAASAQFDGTTTAKDMYLNMLTGTERSGKSTNLVSGTITIHWTNLGDY